MVQRSSPRSLSRTRRHLPRLPRSLCAPVPSHQRQPPHSWGIRPNQLDAAAIGAPASAPAPPTPPLKRQRRKKNYRRREQKQQQQLSDKIVGHVLLQRLLGRLDSRSNDQTALTDTVVLELGELSIAFFNSDLSSLTVPPFILFSQSLTKFFSCWTTRPPIFTVAAHKFDSAKRQNDSRSEQFGNKKKSPNSFLRELFLGSGIALLLDHFPCSKLAFIAPQPSARRASSSYI
ncbi:uncharacterized protein TrAtP1_012088 [Trichoderma atroviride]|uniref:uncharacterized protein n=1 Tax=Hypocrea atroviridis TaxID=63577 RepID=UPI00331D5DF2|nr:hypothetical protein TrAtP1_012088 [Trichoderma atroviride]